MGAVLKVHARVFSCQGCQGSNMRPREMFVSEFAIFFAKEMAKVSLDEEA
jgi:hypothetical protein